MQTQEVESHGLNGWGMLPVLIIVPFGIAWLFYRSIVGSDPSLRVGTNVSVPWIVVSSVLTCIWFFLLFGFFTLQPNQGGVQILFGNYIGTLYN